MTGRPSELDVHCFIHIVIVGIFIVFVIVGVVLIVAFNSLYISMRMKEQNRQFNVYKIKRSSVSFQPTKAIDVVIDRTRIAPLVECEIDKPYVCTVNVGNVGKDLPNPCFCTKEKNDKSVLDTELKQINLQPKKPCAFKDAQHADVHVRRRRAV